jgi:hypothetical protein
MLQVLEQVIAVDDIATQQSSEFRTSTNVKFLAVHVNYVISNAVIYKFPLYRNSICNGGYAHQILQLLYDIIHYLFSSVHSFFEIGLLVKFRSYSSYHEICRINFLSRVVRLELWQSSVVLGHVCLETRLNAAF